MSVNSQSSNSFSSPYLNTSSTNSTYSENFSCRFTKTESIIFSIFCIVDISVLLNLCIFILHHGFRQRQQNSSAVRHSDCFTYHVAILQLIGVFGCFLCLLGIYGNNPQILFAGISFYAFLCYGETFSHILMCLEQYLAVVHPITYMSLRKERGTRIRNISIGCAWLFTIVGIGFTNITQLWTIVSFIQLVTAVAVISFCCLSVLCILIQVRDKVDQSKQRAFYTILAILGVLTVRFLCSFAWVLLGVMQKKKYCWMIICVAWVNFPSDLVLPLLFLQRAGKCLCLIIKNK